MTFFDFSFWVFVAICLILYYIVPQKVQKYILLVASIVFYCFCGVKNLVFIIGVALVTWVGAYLLDRQEKRQRALLSETTEREKKQIIKAATRKRKLVILWTGVSVLIALLCILKYLIPVTRFFGLTDWSEKSIVIPLGISFYTFQAMGYLIDVYNKKIKAEKNLFLYFLFISYFPQITQGPISRFTDLASQFREGRKFEAHNIKQGIIIILWGAFKKLAVADRIAPFVINITGDSFHSKGSIALLTVFLYAIQLYADFSGGIDMAKGVSMLFGIRLPENFKRPYFSVSMTEFWRRWHITLGDWMRDYVFYPLAFSKPMRKLTKKIKKKNTQFAKVFPAIIGNLIVFLLIGIWHGAKMTFVAWGLYNGVVLSLSAVFENKTKEFRLKHSKLVAKKGWYIFCVLRTFLLVLLGYFFDCANTFTDGLKMLTSVFTNFGVKSLFSGFVFEEGLSKGGLIKLLPAVLIIFIVSVFMEKGVNIVSRINQKPLLFRSFIYSGLLVAFLFFTANGFNEVGGFMYAIF